MERDAAHEHLPNKSFSPAKIFHLRREFLHRFCRHPRVEPVGLVPFLVEKRLGAENGMMRENASAQDHRISPGETVFADLDWLRRLPAGVEIDAVSEQLRTEPADGGERADPHPRGAIDQVPAAT